MKKVKQWRRKAKVKEMAGTITTKGKGWERRYRTRSANARSAMKKVKQWRRKAKVKEMAGTITTKGKGWERRYSEKDAFIRTSDMVAEWKSRATTPWVMSTPEPSCVGGGLPPRDVARKLDLDETSELLTRVLAASEGSPDLGTLSAARRTTLGLSQLKKLTPTMSLGVELLTSEVKSCMVIGSSLMDMCLSPFHLHVRTVPLSNVGNTSDAEMNSYGLAALAPLAITHPSPP